MTISALLLCACGGNAKNTIGGEQATAPRQQEGKPVLCTYKPQSLYPTIRNHLENFRMELPDYTLRVKQMCMRS